MTQPVADGELTLVEIAADALEDAALLALGVKARMHEGRRAKAARGELVIGLDEQVRSTIHLVFDVFERRRSVRGVLTYLVDHDIQLPDRVRSGPRKGEVRWGRPNQATLGDM